MRRTRTFASRTLRRLAASQVTTLLPVALLLTACATVAPPSGIGVPQEQVPTVTAPSNLEEEALLSLVTQQDRLYRVAAPLLVNNTELCRGNARNLLGFSAKTKYSYSAEYTDEAERILGLGERLQVMNILSGSGAARAGVRRGDTLVTVDAQPLPQGPNAEREAAAILAPLVSARSSVKLGILRNGESMTLNVPLTNACAFGIELGNTDIVNAYSDGRRVLVTRGMLKAVRSDEELAYVIAKEMAHNALGHAIKQRMVATEGGIIDNLIRVHPDMSTMSGMAGLKPMPQDFDAAADKLSLYMLARAGYRIDNVVPFWRRMASEYPASMLNSYTALHPATDYRLAAMETALADIRSKRAANKVIFP
ncbi:M48 family metallopeptidase [Noviherbaspirillum massiliense]|uniref:M48 family metallopeptidase n=1 Tax=Noviherbaspirillum massiliense TaxID=1465823 RepID=UPI0002FFB9DC|nr:M48 family metallopeptidase [Noviherbaspirillum massiliense]